MTSDEHHQPWKLPSAAARQVLIFSAPTLWAPHFETGLEIAAGHRRAGDAVAVSLCEGGVESCVANPYHHRELCFACVSRTKSGIAAANLANDQLLRKREQRPLRQIKLPTFADIEELKRFEIGGIPLGVGVASSLITTTRESEPIIGTHRTLVESLFRTAVDAYQSALEAIDATQPDLAYLFNGRHAATQPQVLACQTRGVDFYSFEAAYELGRYVLIKNTTVHDLAMRKHMVQSQWDSSDLPLEQRIARGREFFDGRRYGGSGAPLPGLRFNSEQAQGRLPKSFEAASRARRVAIFNSSEDEFAALSDYRNPVYKDQLDALESIANHPWPNDTQLFVRAHPNLSRLDNSQTRRMWALSHLPNVCIIAPEEDVDSYTLVEQSDVVVVFGSTIGVESLYYGTPCVLVGRADYEDLGCLRPTSHEDVVRSIGVASGRPDPRGAIQYGYAMRAWGHRYEAFDHTARSRGYFNGTAIRPSRLARFVQLSGRVARAGDRPTELSSLVKAYRSTRMPPSQP